MRANGNEDFHEAGMPESQEDYRQVKRPGDDGEKGLPPSTHGSSAWTHVPEEVLTSLLMMPQIVEKLLQKKENGPSNDNNPQEFNARLPRMRLERLDPERRLENFAKFKEDLGDWIIATFPTNGAHLAEAIFTDEEPTEKEQEAFNVIGLFIKRFSGC